MKAITRRTYGFTEVLGLEEIPDPKPTDEEILVKVHAASVNKGDWEILRGDPLWVRLVGFGLRTPKIPTLGYDFAGRVEAVGRNVTALRPGDEVVGHSLEHGLGAFAEYVCVPERAAVVRKPASLSFEEAAAIPESGFIALQALREGRLEHGKSVLINGAGGGAGSFAIQLAKSMGAEVTGVDNAEKQDFMRSLGADFVIDYTREDFAGRAKCYDLIVDIVGHHPMSTWKRALKPNGVYLAAGGSVSKVAEVVVVGAWISAISRKKMRMLAIKPNKQDLRTLVELVETGRITPAIDRRYPLAQVPAAIRYLADGHSKGKLVITI